MSGFLLTGIIVAALVSIASMGLAVSLLFSKNKELLKQVKEEVFSEDKTSINNAIAMVESEISVSNKNNISETSKDISPNDFLELISPFELKTKTGFVSTRFFGSILATTLDVKIQKTKPYSAQVLRNINQKALDTSPLHEVSRPSTFSDTETFVRRYS